MALTLKDYYPKIEKVNALIAEIPGEYHRLVAVEQAWASAHPVLAGLAWFGLGVVSTLIAVHI